MVAEWNPRWIGVPMAVLPESNLWILVDELIGTRRAAGLFRAVAVPPALLA